MTDNKIQQRLSQIFDISPPLKSIIFSSDPLNQKKKKFRRFLTDQLLSTFDDDPAIPPLEWVLTRDAVQALSELALPV